MLSWMLLKDALDMEALLVMKDTHDLANKVGRPTARQIKNKNNKYMASDCPLAGKHLKQLEVDTNISNDEALHPIELIAKSYRL